MEDLTQGLGDLLEAHSELALLAGLALLALVAWAAFTVTRRVLLRLVERVIRKSETRWDDALIEAQVLRRASLVAPVLVVQYGAPLVPGMTELLADLVARAVSVGLVLVGALTATGLLRAADLIYRTFPVSQGRPIKGYVQLVQIFVWVMAGVLMVATLLDRSPWGLLTGLGAATAVLLLIFRDTILSLVASIQLVSNDMVRLGDWIEMPKFGADGSVIDVALHTVKVQNWDQTITTIPTYKLIDDSFKNWRGMQESGGRRIKRAIHLDMTSARFLTPDEVERFSGFALLRDYLRAKRQEIEAFNREVAEGPEVTQRARRLTNVGTFRAYAAAYLRARPDIHADGMTFLVRQLPPGPEGLPIELYVFTKTVAWAEYEAIQADVFDHLLAMVPEFDLRVFQKPTGLDLARFGGDGAGRRAEAPEGRKAP